MLEAVVCVLYWVLPPAPTVEDPAAFEERIASSNKESRDLPKAGRESIVEALKGDPGIKVLQSMRAELANNQAQLKNTVVTVFQAT
jgi:hypothetical protein